MGVLSPTHDAVIAKLWKITAPALNNQRILYWPVRRLPSGRFGVNAILVKSARRSYKARTNEI